MALDFLEDGASRLVLVLCLPLIDGVFATLLVTGAVETFSNVLMVALTIFTGAGALAVLYSHAETREQAQRMVLTAVPVLLVGAVAVAIVAPVFADLFHVHRLQYAAGLALAGIALQMGGVRYADKLSAPGILLTGFVLSVQNPAALTYSLQYVAPAVLTAGIAAAGLFLATYLDPDRLALQYLEKGGAIVLLLIALSLFGLNVPSELTLSVFGGSVAAALR